MTQREKREKKINEALSMLPTTNKELVNVLNLLIFLYSVGRVSVEEFVAKTTMHIYELLGKNECEKWVENLK